MGDVTSESPIEAYENASTLTGSTTSNKDASSDRPTTNRVDAAGSGLDVAAAASALSTDATTVAPGARPA